MSSPAGLPFCVCDEQWPHQRPGAMSWPDGHRSRLVQLCVDVPAQLHDAELAFWRAATGWVDEPVDAPEFHRLVHRAESPLQLLVQRLGGDDGATRARATSTSDPGTSVPSRSDRGARRPRAPSRRRLRRHAGPGGPALLRHRQRPGPLTVGPHPSQQLVVVHRRDCRPLPQAAVHVAAGRRADRSAGVARTPNTMPAVATAARARRNQPRLSVAWRAERLDFSATTTPFFGDVAASRTSSSNGLSPRATMGRPRPGTGDSPRPRSGRGHR